MREEQKERERGRKEGRKGGRVRVGGGGGEEEEEAGKTDTRNFINIQPATQI